MDAKHAVISSQSDIDEETGFLESVHGLHTSIAASSDQETCFSKSVCDVDVHLECSLGVEHEENAYAALHSKAIVLDNAIQEGFMSMALFQNTRDDIDRGMDDDQSTTATGYRVCYDDAMEKEIDAIFAMHAETCAIEVERYLNVHVKLPKKYTVQWRGDRFFLYNADGDEWLWNREVSCTMQKQIDSLCNANAYWLISFQCNPSVSHRYEWKFLKATTANIPAHILKNSI
ncbi:hypothetical protein L7F22_029366 [Adiantum nelumboides]|nr:hypothetical protein [Adiantum nelumboides]